MPRHQRRRARYNIGPGPEQAAEVTRAVQGGDCAHEAAKAHLEEQGIRSQLSHKAHRAEGRIGVREDSGVSRHGEHAGGQQSYEGRDRVLAFQVPSAQEVRSGKEDYYST